MIAYLRFASYAGTRDTLWLNAHSLKDWWQKSIVVWKSCVKLFSGIRNTEDLVICLPLRIPLSNPGRTLALWMLMEQKVQLLRARRPKAKAGRRRGGETIASDLILIRYELSTIAGMRVTNRPGAFLICGVDIADVGPDSNDKVMELIETMSA